jgi:hypothetical protein
LPTDLEYGSPRTRAYDDRSSQTSREDSLDQLEEARDMVGDLVLPLCDATTPEGFDPETSRWGTWCFGYDKTPEGATSSHLPGKGCSSSPRF